VYPQEQGRVGADRALVVHDPRAVRRPHLDHPRARAREHIGDPEPVADLDELAARDHDLAAVCGRGEREQHGRRVVVDDERCLRAGEPAERVGDMVLPRAPAARGEVELEVRVRPADIDRARERGRGQRRAPEIRVDDHSRCVQHPAQRG
jgi:hypothetical protein